MIEVKETPLNGLLLIQPRVFRDDRGYFMQSYHRDQYIEAGITDHFVQDNEAVSKLGALRGLHYQTGDAAQSKLVRVVRGAVYDVAVDIRPESETYGQWFGARLTGENKIQMYIPAGFAHGYLSLEDDTTFTYKCGAPYSPGQEGGIRYDDPKLAIEWPLVETGYSLSGKDLDLPLFGSHKPI